MRRLFERIRLNLRSPGLSHDTIYWAPSPHVVSRSPTRHTAASRHRKSPRMRPPRTGRQRARATRPRSSWRARHATCFTSSCASLLVRHDRAQPRGQSPRTARARSARRRRAGCAQDCCQRRSKEFVSIFALPPRSRAELRGFGGERQIQEHAGLGCSRAAR